MNIHCRVCQKFLFVDPNGIEVTDAICFDCDQKETPTMPVDPDLSVYSIPVRLTVEAHIFVLARSTADARTQSVKLNLDDLFNYDGESVECQSEMTSEIDNVSAISFLDPNLKESEPTLVSSHEYDPTDHPDYGDLADDPDGTAEGEGLKS